MRSSICWAVVAVRALLVRCFNRPINSSTGGGELGFRGTLIRRWKWLERMHQVRTSTPQKRAYSSRKQRNFSRSRASKAKRFSTTRETQW